MRRAQKTAQKNKTVTYNLTQEQLEQMFNKKFSEELQKVKKEATEDAVRTSIILMLTLPMEVLIDHYWKKTYSNRIPEFTGYVIDYYKKWENGELDMDKLREDLWERGRVRLIEQES